MMGRGESTEAAWALIASLPPTGHSVGDNGGTCWSAMGRGRRVRSSSYRWRRDRTGHRLLAHLQTTSDAVGERLS